MPGFFCVILTVMGVRVSCHSKKHRPGVKPYYTGGGGVFFVFNLCYIGVRAILLLVTHSVNTYGVHMVVSIDTLELAALVTAVAELKMLVQSMKEQRDPLYELVQVSATTPWIIQRRNRKHLFLWNPGGLLTLSFEDYGSGAVTSQQWVNVGMPTGLRVYAVGQATNVPLQICYTDEVIP